jgi:hypothetical protein
LIEFFASPSEVFMRINLTFPNSLKRLMLLLSVMAMLSLLVTSASNASKTSVAKPQSVGVVKAGGRKAINNHPRGMPAESTAAIIDIRNLDSEHVLRDLEIEVRNNSPKPIYFMRVELDFPDFIIPGPDGVLRHVGEKLIYGRIEMAAITELANAWDKPLNPGETYVFKIPERSWLPYERTLAARKETEAIIKKIGVRLTVVNFGDGTGYKFGHFYPQQQSSIHAPPQLKAALFTSSVDENNIFPSPASYSINSNVSSLSISPQLGCGPAQSNCHLYDEVNDNCRGGAPDGCFKTTYLQSTASSPDPLCGVYYAVNKLCMNTDGGTDSCADDQFDDCQDWLDAGRCQNVIFI